MYLVRPGCSRKVVVNRCIWLPIDHVIRQFLNLVASFPNCVGLSTCQQMMDMYLLFLRPNSVEIPVTAGEFEIGSTTSVAEAWWDHACFCMKDWMRGRDFYINKREQLRPSCTFSVRPSFQSCRDTTAVFRPRYCQQTLYSLAYRGEIHGHT